jgi:hypothetical protein
MRIFKIKKFAKFCLGEGISDAQLIEAVAEIERGKFDADLGSGLFKQRIARRGGGKSGGYRVILFFRIKRRVVFVHGFAKNDTANISSDLQSWYRSLANETLDSSDTIADALVEKGYWKEVMQNGETI